MNGFFKIKFGKKISLFDLINCDKFWDNYIKGMDFTWS